MIVLDASVAVELLLHTEIGIRNEHLVLGQDRHAPHLIDVEFANALRRIARGGALDSRDADDALDLFRDIAITRHHHTLYLGRIWQLRESVSPYDAAYVSLAEALDAPLMTCDARLSRSHGHHARIELLS